LLFQTDVSISADLNAGNAACDAALQRLSDVSNQNNQLQITVASQTNAVTALAADASNMTTLQLQLRSNRMWQFISYYLFCVLDHSFIMKIYVEPLRSALGPSTTGKNSF